MQNKKSGLFLLSSETSLIMEAISVRQNSDHRVTA